MVGFLGKVLSLISSLRRLLCMFIIVVIDVKYYSFMSYNYLCQVQGELGKCVIIVNMF